MVDNKIQGHDFENGGPIKQYELTFQDILADDINSGFIFSPNATFTIGHDAVIDHPQATYVSNLIVTENMDYPPREGEIRCDTSTGSLLVFNGTEWGTYQYNQIMVPEDVYITTRKESMWKRFFKRLFNR
ncbi:MAG: hypothetical protein GTN59_00150 [Candidatus Dadabacteria bacterium]|nr:hypothetical protein [Candidatus Dadabacteria bacterium]